MVDEPARPMCWRVAIVGGGPAGLAAAMALRRRGVEGVVVLEREAEPGGVPRHCGHPVFGLCEFGRPLSGPAYARRLAEAARAAGVDVRIKASVLRLGQGGQLEVATPAGLARVEAERVILATGIRESPRSARLVGGERPWGVVTTGALQAFVYLEGLRPFRRPVIVGTELVSFSAILTAHKAGIRPVAMLEEGSRTTARWPSAWALRLLGIPVRFGTRIVEICGKAQVEAVGIVDSEGRRDRIACDGVVFTGCFVPAAELVRMSHLALDPGSGGPAVDQYGRCADPAFFAAGNLLRPVETAGWCYREGARVGNLVADDLAGRLPAAACEIRIARGSGIKLAVPQRIAVPAGGGLDIIQLRVDRPVRGALQVEADGKLIWHRRMAALPERRLTVPLRSLAIPDGTASLRIGFGD
ncbi:MAG: FAD-dependent oxidoreductase [Pseudomonadota bacterium]